MLMNHTAVERVSAVENAKGSGITFDDTAADVADVCSKVMIDGAMDVDAWSCDMIAGPSK